MRNILKLIWKYYCQAWAIAYSLVWLYYFSMYFIYGSVNISEPNLPIRIIEMVFFVTVIFKGILDIVREK